MNEQKETETMKKFLIPFSEKNDRGFTEGWLARAKLDRTEKWKAVCQGALGLMNIGKSEQAKMVLHKALAEQEDTNED